MPAAVIVTETLAAHWVWKRSLRGQTTPKYNGSLEA